MADLLGLEVRATSRVFLVILTMPFDEAVVSLASGTILALRTYAIFSRPKWVRSYSQRPAQSRLKTRHTAVILHICPAICRVGFSSCSKLITMTPGIAEHAHQTSTQLQRMCQILFFSLPV